MFVVAFGLGWYIMKKYLNIEGESIEKLDSLYGQFSYLERELVWDTYFFDWEYFLNHL
jgi:hypothetical protein